MALHLTRTFACVVVQTATFRSVHCRWGAPANQDPAQQFSLQQQQQQQLSHAALFGAAAGAFGDLSGAAVQRSAPLFAGIPAGMTLPTPLAAVQHSALLAAAGPGGGGGYGSAGAAAAAAAATVAGVVAAAAAVAGGQQQQDEMPLELRIAAARAEKQKRMEVSRRATAAAAAATVQAGLLVWGAPQRVLSLLVWHWEAIQQKVAAAGSRSGWHSSLLCSVKHSAPAPLGCVLFRGVCVVGGAEAIAPHPPDNCQDNC